MAIKVIHVILLASVKYIFTLPYAMIIGFEYKLAIILVLIGGIGGFLFFYYMSKPLLLGFNIAWPCICKIVPPGIKTRYAVYCERRIQKRNPRIFSKKSRFIVKIRTTYGLWGIVFATPVLLTIPVGAFLANKYYSTRKYIVFYMILSIIGWAAVLSGLVHLFPNVFF